MSMKSINPATGEMIQEYQKMTVKEVDRVIADAHAAFLAWQKTSFTSRAKLMKNAAQILRDNAGAYGKLMTQEMGKPIAGGRAEAEKCAWVCDYYADNAEIFLQPEIIATDAGKSFVTF